MVCVYCDSPTHVTNSRQQHRSNDIWRRRTCTVCGSVFTSLETTDLASALRIEQPQGHYEPFVRDKLFVSIYESCKHRPTVFRDAANVTQQIIGKLLRAQIQPGLITRAQIVSTSHTVLKQFDTAAATYYAAYHPAARITS